MDMNFEIDDIVKLSPKAKQWTNGHGQPWINNDNLQFETEYKITNSITAGAEEWVDISASIIIFPAWCFTLIKKSNSNLRQQPTTIIQTGIPGVTIIR